jgi:N-acyl-D-amino-acid deacylase
LVSTLLAPDTQSSGVEKAESTPKSAAPPQDDVPTASVSAVGPLEPAMASFDEIVKAFVAKHHIPSAAFAATDGGKVVFARGYQVATESASTPVEPKSLFRIASLSKPITAVGILKLVEQGRVELSTPVFSILNFENEFVLAGEQWDKRLKEVTIRQLLEHRGGWDRDASFDPMFKSVQFAQELGIASPAGPRDIIRAMLTRPLDFDPGQRYAYSNFGYCLLGRVIESVSGMTYGAYIQQHILKPIGIESMQLGKTRASDRAVGEVCYQHALTGKSVFQVDLGSDVPEAYGAWYLEAMDAHGGWIASVIDLARFASAFDDPDHCCLLRADSIRLMHDRPDGLAGYDEHGQPRDVFYSLGWQNRVVNKTQFNRWHTGSLPGTTAIMIRRHDGRNLIALLNTRESPATDNLSLATDLILHKAANSVQDWAATKPNDNSLSVAR